MHRSLWTIPCSFVEIVGASAERAVLKEKSAERAEMILEGYRKFITHTCSLKKSQQPDGKKSMTHDPLLPAKLKFFEMVPSKLNSFLRGFQPNTSHGPFYCWHPWRFGSWFCGRIILKDVLKKKSNLYNLIQVNSLDKNRKNSECVNIIFAAKHKLEQIKSSLNFANILELNKKAGDFLVQLLHHLLEKSPLMDILFQKFLSLCRISARSAKLVKKQYQKFVIVIDQSQQLFSSFNPTSDRIDTLFPETTGSSDEHGDLSEFVKMFLILFHG